MVFLKTFPRAVQRDIGQAIFAAQCGEDYPSIKALKSFKGASVLEIVAPYDTRIRGQAKDLTKPYAKRVYKKTAGG